MRRVVVTGMGIWSCIGQDLQTVTENLKQGRSGIIFEPNRIELGLQSGLVANIPKPNLKPYLPRICRITMSEEAEYAYMAARQAFEQAGVSESYLLSNEVGIIFGSDGNTEVVNAVDIVREERDSWTLPPGTFFKVATSSANMNLAACFHLKGINMCISAGCASSSHAIGVATMLIRNGQQSMMIVGGASGINVYNAAPYDALNTISVRNNAPDLACRPFDRDRDGAIMSGGAAALVLEEYEHAVARGATIFAEVVGYGFSSSNVDDIYMHSSESMIQAISRALEDAGVGIDGIDYINSCASSSVTDDVAEAIALDGICKGRKVHISSTESMTGHEGWMGGASEAIYSILMMQNNFVAPNINLERKIDEAKNLNIVTEVIYTPIRTVLSDSAGLGGTNSALVFRKVEK